MTKDQRQKRAVQQAQATATNYAGRRGVIHGYTGGTKQAAGRHATVTGYATLALDEGGVVLVALDAPVSGSWRLDAAALKNLRLTVDLEARGILLWEERFLHIALGAGDLTLDDGTEL